MAQMNKLTINGESFDIEDKGAVRFDSDQSLTELQQERIRANIGAIGGKVTIENNVLILK